MKPTQFFFSAAAACLLVYLTACGGGASSSTRTSGNSPQPLIIATDSILPGTLENQAYGVTLQALNGVGQLMWSIAPVSANAEFVDGLTINASTGLLSGTAGFTGTAAFIATVTDSATPPRQVSKSFTVTASSPLQAPPPQTVDIGQFQEIPPVVVGALNGVQPLTFTVVGACLPFGLRLDSKTGVIRGSTTVVGTYPCSISISDSYSPPELVTAQLMIRIGAPPLSIADSLPRQILLSRPFSGKAIATGGMPPYKFTLATGSLPVGFDPIDNSGQVHGTPTALGQYTFGLDVADSSSPPQSASTLFRIQVVTPMGRNDTVATATPIANGEFDASISPYIDPPDNAPLPADSDYYKLVSLADSVVHIETEARRWWPGEPLDTVIEIVDGSSTRFSRCRQPGETTPAFDSGCINDDISAGVLDSALDFQVPGSTNTPTVFYVHVFDWRGDARNDMRYALQVSGVVAPLSIQTTSLLPAARGLAYTQQLTATGSIGATSWSLASGNLPPGLFLNSSGSITGAGTADGTYSFTLKAADSGNPPQTATSAESIQVVEPVKITSPSTWPDGCVGQPYSFSIQTTGGKMPLAWSFVSGHWMGISLNQSTGVFSGMSGVAGTFQGTVGVNDATTHGDSQQVTITINQCP